VAYDNHFAGLNAMQEKVGIHCWVSGKVHGVWFRAETQKIAKNLGLTGWVRNLPDGRVEVLACGERSATEQLASWLQHGPELAKVTEVIKKDAPWESFKRFSIL